MNSYGINPLTLMEYYAHFTHGETEASRHFDFMMLLGVWGFFFFLGHLILLFHIIHIL